ncbi:hypothetical protein BC943DRAFT_327178 [Umbelopsis sp. AD052]|nr:hypothetical protein BC943DRAFT_327178 [Umbelopsis sp. AD052]
MAKIVAKLFALRRFAWPKRVSHDSILKQDEGCEVIEMRFRLDDCHDEKSCRLTGG